MKNFVLFGAGKIGKSYIDRIGRDNILCFCDNNSSKWETTVENVWVISPRELKNILDEQSDIKIVISSRECYEEIRSQLTILGWEKRIVNIDDICKLEKINENGKVYYKGIYDDINYGLEEQIKHEYLKGELVKGNQKKEIYALNECVFAVKSGYPKTNFTIDKCGRRYSKELSKERYEYFKLGEGEKVELCADKDFIVSAPLLTKDGKEWDTKLNLLIICDSLAQIVIDNGKLRELMPNTFRFFEKGIKFTQCYSGSDWTLPGIATIHTGLPSKQHKLLHPRESGNVVQGRVVSEVFQREGFLTSYYGSNWRAAPQYGYLRGVDRMVYLLGKHKGTAIEMISNFMEFLRAFPNRSHFAVLNLFDLHHFMKESPDISSQLSQTLDEHFYSDKYEGKSIFRGYDEVKTNIYTKEISRLDNYLGILYKFLEDRYDNSMNVVFSADHGVSYVKPQKIESAGTECTLDEQMTKVPLLIRTPNTYAEVVEQTTSNTCIFKVLEKMAQGEVKLDNNIIKEIVKIPYAYNESIYPGQTYKATIIDDKYEVIFVNSSIVKDDCEVKLNESGYFFEVRNRKKEEMESDSSVKEKYLNIIKEHIKENDEKGV